MVVDESLSPNVGRALRQVGYLTRLVEEIAELGGVRGVRDEDLIPWMGDRNAVWIHADDDAKRRHRKLLLANQVRTLWVRRAKNGMSSREQLRVLSYVLDRFLENLRTQRGERHYEVRVHGASGRTRIQLRAVDL